MVCPLVGLSAAVGLYVVLHGLFFQEITQQVKWMEFSVFGSFLVCFALSEIAEFYRVVFLGLRHSEVTTRKGLLLIGAMVASALILQGIRLYGG